MNEENEKLRELVFMAIGEASMCWSEVPSGIFESTRAKKIGDKLIEGISRHPATLEPLAVALQALRDISVPNSVGYGQIARDALEKIKRMGQ